MGYFQKIYSFQFSKKASITAIYMSKDNNLSNIITKMVYRKFNH